MRKVTRAAEAIRARPVGGRDQASPPEYYELNRIWMNLDVLRKRIGGGR